jgi:hypothetical protein
MMNRNLFYRISCLALLLAITLAACTAAPPPTSTSISPTDIPILPTATVVPTIPTPPTDTPILSTATVVPKIPPPPDGAYRAVITAEDYIDLALSADEVCENSGTFTLIVSGESWLFYQEAAPGCTVQGPVMNGAWKFSGNLVELFRDGSHWTGESYTYKWSFNGTNLEFTKVSDSSPIRTVYLSSHPYVKQDSIPRKLQELGLWEDATGSTIGETAGWTNNVELADLNNDGLVDILFANGGMVNIPGTPEPSQIFLNQGPRNNFKEITESVFGSTRMLARVIKARDVNGDGHADILVGTTFQSQNRLYLGDASGNFTDVTATYLPKIQASIGDVEFGDVDGDGDLDLVLVDNGSGNLLLNSGGHPLLWLNDGSGHFTDGTAAHMPDLLIKMGWDLELLDVDNDYDLDILVMCLLVGEGNLLFENDGTGTFTDVTSGRLPRLFSVTSVYQGIDFTTNDYEAEVMDLNGDGYLDLATLNHEAATGGRIFINNQHGGFEDDTAGLWPVSENLPVSGHNIVILDYDSDGDADFMIGYASPLLLSNDGSGNLEVEMRVCSGEIMPTSPNLAIADLDGDHKLDVVMALDSPDYETTPYEDRVFLGKIIQPDAAPPVITLVEQAVAPAAGQAIQIRARIHDNKSPSMPQDWQSVILKWTADGKTEEIPMLWYGEYLWRGVIDSAPIGSLNYQVCATDAAGNQACSEPVSVTAK